MVDGIYTNPSVPGAGVAKGEETYSNPYKVKELTASFKSEDSKKIQGSGTEDNGGLSAAIKKAAEAKLDSLRSGNVQDFLKAAEEIINASLPQDPPDTRLRIDQDDATGVFVYQGVDKKSGEVVRQWPADEILKFLAFYREQEGAEGIVVDEKA